MTSYPWKWNEFQAGGTDYSNPAEVQIYDQRMSELRDFQAENQRILDVIALKPDDKLLEIGCGTGAFVCAAAKICRQVTACDVSRPMLDYAAQRARKAQCANTTFLHAGFLSLPTPPASFDCIVSQLVLHHLPDFWKGVALQHVAELLSPQGRFYLADVVFDFPVEKHQEHLEAWIAGFPEGMRENAAHHAAQEYSAFDWQMEAIFEKAGLKIETMQQDPAYIRRYLLRKG